MGTTIISAKLAKRIIAKISELVGSSIEEKVKGHIETKRTELFIKNYQKKLEEDIRCPLEYGLAIFGGKWKSRIICVLAVNEKLRYSQLRKEMYNITDAVLVATLKDLVEDGIAERKSYNSTNRMGW